MLFVPLLIILLLSLQSCLSLEISVECERDAVGIICIFDDNLVSDSRLEITSVIAYNGLSSGEIENEEIVEFVVKNLTEFVPRKIGEKFKNIQNLLIHSSSLKFINRTDFADNLTQLEVLSLFNNKIESIPYDAFYDLPLLRHLDIESNLITFLEPQLLSNSIHLHVFAAGSNLIEEIHENFFANNEKLWKIVLNDNKIMDFRHNFQTRINESENLLFVDLQGNPGLPCIKLVNLCGKEPPKTPDIRVTISSFQNLIDDGCLDEYE